MPEGAGKVEGKAWGGNDSEAQMQSKSGVIRARRVEVNLPETWFLIWRGGVLGPKENGSRMQSRISLILGMAGRQTDGPGNSIVTESGVGKGREMIARAT